MTSLLISQADQSDSGEYTCDPASFYPQSIIVHVTKGELMNFFNIFFLNFLLLLKHISMLIIYVKFRFGGSRIASKKTSKNESEFARLDFLK